MHGDADLPEVRQAGCSPGFVLGRRQGRKQQCRKDGYDADHHQQFNEGEPAAIWHRKVIGFYFPALPETRRAIHRSLWCRRGDDANENLGTTGRRDSLVNSLPVPDNGLS
jgi:hypothetical protein